jgi:mannuronan synthase
LEIPTRLHFKNSVALAIGPTLFWLSLAFLVVVLLPERAWHVRGSGLLVVGAIGLWRYAWQLINALRAGYYSLFVFPKLRKAAENLPVKYPSRLYLVIPSYFEDIAVSREVFRAIVREIQEIPSEVKAYVSVGSKEEAELITHIVKSCPGNERLTLFLLKQEQGKRVAMGHILRAIARDYNRISEWHEDAANDLVIFMDGDSLLGSHVLKKSLPFFRLMPDLGAATTDEMGIVYTQSKMAEEWYNIKFSRRNNLMKSHSLSYRVLTLTGRFSVFRTALVVNEEFVRYVEADHMDHWLFGRFRFLMGDDKSTWFYLYKTGWKMLYVPDALVYSLESRQMSFFKLSFYLLFRWSGNMLRTNWRAITLGSRKAGSFLWCSLLDQRISMWTTLVGPVGILLLTIFNSIFYLPFYFVWVILVRTMQLWILVLQGHRLRVYHLPLLIYDQWLGSLVKIFCVFNLDKQIWIKTREEDALHPKVESFAPLRRSASWLLMFVYSLFFVVVLSLVSGAIRYPKFFHVPWHFF